MARHWLLFVLLILNIAANATYYRWLAKQHAVEPWLSADALSLGQLIFAACFSALWRMPLWARAGLGLLLALGIRLSSLLAWETPFEAFRCLAAGVVAATVLRVAGISVSDSISLEVDRPWQFQLTKLFGAMAWLALGLAVFATEASFDPEHLPQVRQRLVVEIVAIYVLIAAPVCLFATLRGDPRGWRWFSLLAILIGLGVVFSGVFVWRVTGWHWTWQHAWGAFEGADYWRVHAQILCPLLINLLLMQGLGWRVQFKPFWRNDTLTSDLSHG